MVENVQSTHPGRVVVVAVADVVVMVDVMVVVVPHFSKSGGHSETASSRATAFAPRRPRRNNFSRNGEHRPETTLLLHSPALPYKHSLHARGSADVVDVAVVMVDV